MQDIPSHSELNLLDQLIAAADETGRRAGLGSGPELRERAETADFVRRTWAGTPSVRPSEVWRSMRLEKRAARQARPGIANGRLPRSLSVKAASLAAALVLAGGIGFSILLNTATPAAAEFAQDVAAFSDVTDAALTDGVLTDGELITLNEWATGLLDQASGNATSLNDLTEAELAEVVLVLEEVDVLLAPAVDAGHPVAIEVQRSVRALLAIVGGGEFAAATADADESGTGTDTDTGQDHGGQGGDDQGDQGGDDQGDQGGDDQGDQGGDDQGDQGGDDQGDQGDTDTSTGRRRSG